MYEGIMLEILCNKRRSYHTEEGKHVYKMWKNTEGRDADLICCKVEWSDRISRWNGEKKESLVICSLLSMSDTTK